MPGLSFVVVGFQISSASLGCYVFSKHWCCMFHPPSSHISFFFQTSNLEFGKLVTGEVPSEACEGGDPVTLTSSQLGKGNGDVI